MFKRNLERRAFNCFTAVAQSMSNLDRHAEHREKPPLNVVFLNLSIFFARLTFL